MDYPKCSFTRIPFPALPQQEHVGKTGAMLFRQADQAGIRMRVVDYAPGYLTDHWCDRGHFAYVLAGVVTIELQGKDSHVVQTGEAFVVSTGGDAAHRLSTKDGARVLLVD